MKKQIIVTGMNCGHCVARIRGLFEENKEVTNVEINLEDKSIVLESVLSDEQIVYILGEKYTVVSIHKID
ncbi:heavy-metal-associated domain-containing protein [[Clostridium] dakarense]|uniref:heavy-metal-associated domain-containing protein n=1 Tax=Faecalimicrobium dakarense TaxID=1301100 RepID=UPI0004BA823C|nr:heavy-metal-associated domain-containing protein [[Clostridium] dakarense]